jgi:hypothetical protein
MKSKFTLVPLVAALALSTAVWADPERDAATTTPAQEGEVVATGTAAGAEFAQAEAGAVTASSVLPWAVLAGIGIIIASSDGGGSSTTTTNP